MLTHRGGIVVKRDEVLNNGHLLHVRGIKWGIQK